MEWKVTAIIHALRSNISPGRSASDDLRPAVKKNWRDVSQSGRERSICVTRLVFGHLVIECLGCMLTDRETDMECVMRMIYLQRPKGTANFEVNYIRTSGVEIVED